MGVVHKLKTEIVEYIIQQKQADPGLSCRKLSVLIKENFQTDVSKSSVNSILKKSKLSSGVGRPPIDNKNKFKIPEKKKAAIKADLDNAKKQDVAIDQHTKEDNKSNDIQNKEKEDLKKKIDNLIIEEEPKNTKSEEETDVLLEKESKAKISVDNEEILESKEEDISLFENVQDEGLFYSAGTILLKALQWNIFSKKFLKQFTKNTPSLYKKLPKDLELACEKRILDHILGENCQITDRPHGLELFYDSEICDIGSVCDMSIDFGISTQYEYEKEQWFLPIEGFEVFFEDGHSFIIDASLSMIRSAEIPKQFHRYLDNALLNLSEYIISNRSIPYFLSLHDRKGNFSQAFFDFVAAFENLNDKRMQKIIVFGNDHKEIAEFSVLPEHKRFFVSAVWPWQKEFNELKELSDKSGFDFKDLSFPLEGKTLQYKELRTDFVHRYLGYDGDLRAILVFEEKEPIFCLLTNNWQKSSLRIIERFLLSFKDVDFKENTDFVSDIMLLAESIIPKKSDNLENNKEDEFYFDLLSPKLEKWDDILRDFAYQICTFAQSILKYEIDGQKQFFWKKIIAMSGKIKLIDNFIIVELQTADDAKDREFSLFLDNVLTAVNIQRCKDPFNRQIIFCLK